MDGTYELRAYEWRLISFSSSNNSNKKRAREHRRSSSVCFVGVSPSQSLVGGTVLIKHGFQQLSPSSLLYLFPKKDV